MTFQSDSEKVGRQPVRVVELELDFCANTYGVAPCEAAGASKCFNTFATCQDQGNYVKTTKVYRFVDAQIEMPVASLDAIPCIDRIRRTPPELTPSEGLGSRAVATIQMRDFPHNDRLIDKYATERSYDPYERGTFWGKFKARNPFYVGRPCRILEGYRDADGTFDLADFEVRHYIIESIDGPDRGDRVTIKAKDPLKKLDGDRAQCPLASDGVLDSNISSTTTTIPLAPGYTTTYSDKYIRIGDEIIDVSAATFSSGTWSSVARGVAGTEADEHDAGDTVQDCKSWDGVNVIDILKELIEDFAGVDPAFVPYAGQWTDEKNASLTSFNLTSILSEPESVRDLINEIAEEVLLEVYWAEVAQEIRIKHETQWVEDSAELNDSDHLIKEETDVEDRHDLRISRVWVFYGVRNWAEKIDRQNMDKLVVNVDLGAEGTNEFNEIKVRKVFSRWFPGNDSTPANLLGQRLVQRFADTPKAISFALDARHHKLATLGEVVRITTRHDQLPDGRAREARWQIISMQPEREGHKYKYEALKYAGVPETEVTISSDTRGYNLYNEIGQPPDPVNVTLTIESGVTVYGRPALDLGGLHPDSTVTIINKGTIWGSGGAGGAGGEISSGYESEPPGFWLIIADDGKDGEDGGDALNVTCDTVIDNASGFIIGGAGGGGGGGATGAKSDGHIDAGGGGGAGIGFNSPAGGAGGAALNDPDGIGHSGEAGGAGNDTSPGSGGRDGSYLDAWDYNGDGGDGGGNASDGQDGETPTVDLTTSAGGKGGTAGLAIKTNGNVVDIQTGNTIGRVVGTVD